MSSLKISRYFFNNNNIRIYNLFLVNLHFYNINTNNHNNIYIFYKEIVCLSNLIWII